MRNCIVSFVVVVLVCVLFADTQAQSKKAEVFFRGRSLEQGCSGFPILEWGYNMPLLYKKQRFLSDSEGEYFHTDFGFMKNVNRFAIGSTLFIARNSDTFRVGPRLRLRRWLDKKGELSLDVSPGVIFDKHGSGVIGSVGLNFGDRLIVNVIGEATRGDTAVYAGFTVGSHVAAITGGIAAIIGFITMDSDISWRVNLGTGN